jgi:hypothetical protein
MGGCYVTVTSLVLFGICDILKYMNDLQITCNYCDMPAKLKRDKIYMQCHCCDDRRIIDLREYLLEDKHHDYLYSMFNDNFVYNAAKA